MDKATLRKLYLAKRRQLAPSLREQYLAEMLRMFRTLELPDLRHCLLYQPILRHAEIALEPFAAAIREQFPHCVFSYPVTLEDFSCKLIAPGSKTEFVPSSLGIMEPTEGELIMPAQLDLIFVPLVCYDSVGYRVGYGKGVYDRILAQSRADALKLGLSYFPPVASISDLHAQDQPLDIVISPEQLYAF